MAEPKLRIIGGKETHYTVGAIIERDGKYFILDRALPPYGWACPAGHLGEGERSKSGLERKAIEETGMRLKSAKLIHRELIPWNTCRADIDNHYWYMYKCETEGEAKLEKEAAKSYKWATPEEIRKMKLEPVWKYWLEKFKII